MIRGRTAARVFGCWLIAGVAATTAASAQAQSAEDFFKSTQLTMYVGSGAGGGYDTLARLVARHMSRYLPGQPSFVVKNIPAASGVQSANFVFNSAPRDGSAILAATNASLILPLYGSPVAQYDPRKFEWIGSVFKQQAICVSWHTVPVKTLEDATRQEITMGATGVSGGPGVFPRILNNIVGTRFKLITGYTTGDMRLALEKREVDGICGLAWQTYKTVSREWIENKKLNIFAQMGLEKHPDLPHVAQAFELIKNPADRQVLELLVVPQEFGRPFVAPPGVPADRMAIYRQAFQALLRDEQFLAELARQGGSIEPLDDKQIQALLERAYAAPKEIRDRAGEYAASMN
jgi:tripartite-type tricarboxylate transporter receptor subunit TctC